MNNRSQLANIMLPVVVLVLAVSAIYVMISFSQNFSSHEAEINSIVSRAEFNHDYIISQSKLLAKNTLSSCPDCSAENFKAKFKEESQMAENLYRLEGAGNFYGKIRNNEFDVTKEGENYILKVANIFVESESGFNKVKRNFNICLVIKEKGVYECSE